MVLLSIVQCIEVKLSSGKKNEKICQFAAEINCKQNLNERVPGQNASGKH